MKSSLIRHKIRLTHFRRPFSLKRHAVPALLVASLLLSILIAYSPRRAGAQAQKPFDLKADFKDANGFEINPRWAWQDANPNAGLPDPNILCFNSAGAFEGCTTDAVEFDEPDPWKILRRTCRLTAGTTVKGHINWRPVFYDARISWSEFSIDGDYCLEIAPLNRNGLTSNRPTLHVEFHAGETIKDFDTPWWKEFRNTVGIRNIGFGSSKKEREFVNKFVNGKRARVIGLLNLDCVHKCYTELHPVYALAINIKTEIRGDGTVDDVWAIFARNWGNEGWCSSKQHDLNLASVANKLSLSLPWGPDTTSGGAALSFEIVPDGTRFLSSSDQATGPELSIAGNQGILATFVLPKATDQEIVHGELRLRWSMPPAWKNQSPGLSAASTMSAALPEVQGEEREEELLSEVLGEEGRKTVENDIKSGKPHSVLQTVTVKREIGINRAFSIWDTLTRTEKLIIQPPPPAQPPRVESRYDPEKAERDRRLLGIPPNSP